LKLLIYYLPGHGGSLGAGLGEGLLSRGYEVTGRETQGDFLKLPFEEQVDTVATDLRDHFWREDAQVICVSFGAYVFLHAQAQLPPFPGKVLLLSPILGEFKDDSTSLGFIPPRAGKLMRLAREGSYPAPKRCEVHVGSEDWQSQPDVVTEFGKLTGIAVTVAQGRGHDLGKDYVGPLLDRL
jgi:pimeloyl-ACP methyl ester carboxylesterase